MESSQSIHFKEEYCISLQNVGTMTTLKATKLAEEHNFYIHDTEGFDPCESDRNSCPNNTPLFSFQANKAPGCDKVEVKILKDSSPVIAPIVTSLINSFTLSSFPLPWKKAEIVLILKSGDSEEPANTRPIPLLPILSKICERAAHLQFTDFLHSNNVIHHKQSGNRKLHSTEAVLLHLTDELRSNMDQKKISVIVLLNMSKAFDSIRHDLIIRKLRRAGVSESACAQFESYLSQRQVVKFLIPYPLRLEYRKDPSWARCCLHCM